MAVNEPQETAEPAEDMTPWLEPGQKSVLPPLAKLPRYLTPELTERWYELRRVMEDNARQEMELAPYGVHIPLAVVHIQRLQALINLLAEERGVEPLQVALAPDPGATLTNALNCLTETLYPFGTLEGQGKQLELDMIYQGSLGEFLSTAKSDVIKAQLAEGSSLSPEMIRALNKQASQLLGRPGLGNGPGPGLIRP